MTNEEAYKIISEFCFTGFEDNKKPSYKLFGAIHELILDVEENKKLKAEIENSNRIISNMIDEHECGIVGRNVEIINLKAEIEQLKSTISKMETTTAQEDDLK